jgi:hypothetical protein
MGFRCRRSTRLGPLRFHFTSGGLSSISVGARRASFNINDAERRARRCITAVQDAPGLAVGRGRFPVSGRTCALASAGR